MAKARLFELPETKGEIKIRGVVKGTQKDSFFETILTKSGKPMNLVKFGLDVDKNSPVYMDLSGQPREEVFFYKRSEVKGQKGTTKRIPWNKRESFNEDGFNLIGMQVGLEKVIDDKGKEKNDVKTFVEYDACEYIAEKLEDGDSLFVLGQIDFGSYKNKQGEVKRSVRFVPDKILGAKPIDFDSEDFEKVADFKQKIVFMSATLDNSDSSDVKGIIEAKIVKYSAIEDAEFIVRDKKLFALLKKNLKPFTAIDVWGNINNKIEKEEVLEDDGWGSSNPFEKTNTPMTRELVITGADPSSIDTDTYNQSEMDNALETIANNNKAKDEFGDNNTSNSTWGSSQSASSGEDDIAGWD